MKGKVYVQSEIGIYTVCSSFEEADWDAAALRYRQAHQGKLVTINTDTGDSDE